MTERHTILAIDDDPVVTEYLESKLGARYRIVTTNIPANALELARAEKPDLILVDVDMEGVDGFEVCRRLKLNGIADTPVVFLTGRTDSADEVRGFEAGGVDYIHKHLERDVLEARVRQQISLQKVQKALQYLRGQIPTQTYVVSLQTMVFCAAEPKYSRCITCTG